MIRADVEAIKKMMVLAKGRSGPDYWHRRSVDGGYLFLKNGPSGYSSTDRF
jgi:hypothetical protein